MDFNKKRNGKIFNETFLFRIFGIIFLIAVIALIITDFRIYQKKKELASRINDYQKQIEDIKKSNQNLEDETANSNNQEYLEKIAYEQLNKSRPGETVYSFIMPEEKPKIVNEEKNFWDNFTAWLSGSFSWLKSKF